MIHKRELKAALGITSRTIKSFIESGKLPKPDFASDERDQWWKESTLEAVGIEVPSQRSPEASGAAQA